MSLPNNRPTTDNNALVVSLANTLLALCEMDREAVIALVRQQEGSKPRRVVFDLGGAARFGKIDLIKAVRSVTGLGLADAKAAVEGADLPVDLCTSNVVQAINVEFRSSLERWSRRDPSGGSSFYLDQDNRRITDYLATGHVPCTLV